MSVTPIAARARAGGTALVLGGGNALGAYLAGAVDELRRHGIEPGQVVGASIGAITGAILAGNPPERRAERLLRFWEEAAQPDGWLGAPRSRRARERYNGAHVLAALAWGRPTVFRQRFPGLWSLLPWLPDDVALYDHAPLARTLERLVDFDRLNRAELPFSLVCTDLETGEEVWFDNRRDRIGPEHLLASSAIAPLYPPVEVGGRLLADPAFVNNLPLDRVFAEPPARDTLCFAVELVSRRDRRPGSLKAVLERAQDIGLANHARRHVAALGRELALRRRLDPGSPAATVAHLAYRAADHERFAKALDFSPASVRDRVAAGRRDMGRALALLAAAPNAREPLTYLPVDAGPGAAGLAAAPRAASAAVAV